MRKCKLEAVPGKGYRFMRPVEFMPLRPEMPTAVSTSPEPYSGCASSQPSRRADKLRGAAEGASGGRGGVRVHAAAAIDGRRGFGKTRLAIRLVRELLNDFSNGV